MLARANLDDELFADVVLGCADRRRGRAGRRTTRAPRAGRWRRAPATPGGGAFVCPGRCWRTMAGRVCAAACLPPSGAARRALAGGAEAAGPLNGQGYRPALDEAGWGWLQRFAVEGDVPVQDELPCGGRRLPAKPRRVDDVVRGRRSRMLSSTSPVFLRGARRQGGNKRRKLPPPARRRRRLSLLLLSAQADDAVPRSAYPLR